MAGRQRTGDGRGPESGMARNAPELVATAWAEVMDAIVIAEKGRSVILPEVALVTPGCILVPISRQAMGAAQQLVEVLFGRLLDLQMRPVPVPASDLPADDDAPTLRVEPSTPHCDATGKCSKQDSSRAAAKGPATEI